MNLRRFSTLQIALGVSIAVHAGLLTVRFVDPESFNRVFQETPLEVVLVNARTRDRADKARAIAQTTMAGGGEADTGRATSPLPSSSMADNSDALTDETQQRIKTLQNQQTLLLAQVRAQIAALPRPDLQQPNVSAVDTAQEDKRQQLVKLLAEIEHRINQENRKPKKRYISPSTREAVYAIYYNNLRRAIEDKGTDNFPEAGGKKLYGELTMVITVNHTGQILSTEVVESSGNLALDKRAENIARSSAPFGIFSPAMRAQADQIVVVSRFRFSRDEVLETRVTNR